MDKVEQEFQYKGEKYRKRYMNAVYQLYKDDNKGNLEAKVERSMNRDAGYDKE